VMAYWGMSMANINNAKRAVGFLKEARKRASSLERRQLLYIEALESFFKEGANAKIKRQGWLQGLETIVQEFPTDIDARAWLAMVTWQNAMDGIGSRQAVDTLLDTVLQVEPMHPGAHHYRIHLWDGQKPVRAEKSAALYARTAPGIAHAWHMPGHTYTGLHRYADAAYQQEGSARVDHAYMMRDRVMPFEIHNYAHNNQWLCTSLSHVGRARDAIAVARNLVEQPRDPQKNGPNDGGSAQRSGRARWAEILTRYELWDELIEATSTGALDWSNIPLEQEQKAYTLGLAYAAKNDKAKLADQITALKKLSGVGAKAALAELEGLQLLAQSDIPSPWHALTWLHVITGSPRAPHGRPWTRTQTRLPCWLPRSRFCTPPAKRKRPARPISRSRRSPARPTAICRSSADWKVLSPAGKPTVHGRSQDPIRPARPEPTRPPSTGSI
jgi:hypothetical protein